MEEEPKVVKAIFTFKGSNNDELNFAKGDIITITQKIDGGWWEGTLNGTTGWFPSNYVKEVKQENSTVAQNGDGHLDLSIRRESQIHYRNVVLQSLIESERVFVNELQKFLLTYLHPLHETNIVTQKEYFQLIGNLEGIIAFHRNMLTSLDDFSSLPVHQQKIGGFFLKAVPQIRQLYEKYYSNHPVAALVIANKKEELASFMESKGATSPGHMTLTMKLSQPITRLDKYPNALKELERHTEESHIDRGDTQRAISVYKKMCGTCSELRREKEAELDILSSNIIGWEGEDISQLGDVHLLSHVKVLSPNGERKEQIFLAFKNVLVMLLVSPRRSSYTYEGRLPLSGLSVKILENTEDYVNAIEIGGPLIERRVVCCANSSDQRKLLDGLTNLATPNLSIHSTPQQSTHVTKSQPIIGTMTQAKAAKGLKSNMMNTITGCMWTMSCLRPAPPVRPPLLRADPNLSPNAGRRTWSSRRKPVDEHRTLEDDAQLLKVIEAYCTSAKTRQTVNSLILLRPRASPTSNS